MIGENQDRVYMTWYYGPFVPLCVCVCVKGCAPCDLVLSGTSGSSLDASLQPCGTQQAGTAQLHVAALPML